MIFHLRFVRNRILQGFSGQENLPHLTNWIVDIGTSYYVEEDRDSAKDYFKRKVEFVSEQMEKIEIQDPIQSLFSSDQINNQKKKKLV
jgi:prefoldin subunit 5